MRFFLGGYSADLHLAELDAEDGSMKIVSTVATPQNASFLRFVPGHSVLYATVEAGSKTGESGRIAAYRFDGDALSLIGTAESCGAGPCHIGTYRKLLATANYGGESFAVIRISDDGALGEQAACVRHTGSSVNSKRQNEPHPHATTFSPGGTHLYVCDLGTDTVMRYDVDALVAGRSADRSAGSVAATAPAGAGPRHLEFTRDGGFAYLITELANTVIVYACDPRDGSLTQVQEISTLPDDHEGESFAAEIQIRPDGRFVYGSNRGHNSIVVYARNETDGTLETAGYFDANGREPRHFQIDPGGTWCLVANQGSGTVSSFRIDARSGIGTWTGETIACESPSCVEFVP
jgi:6-phosphogluconolactonase